MTIYHEPIQQISYLRSTTFKVEFIILTSMGLIFNDFFIGPESHRFRASSSRVIARNGWIEGWMLATMVGKENFGILDWLNRHI